MGAPTNGHVPILGQHQQVMVEDVVIAPQLFFEVVRDAAGIPLVGSCLRIIDAMRQRAIFSPLTPQAARTIAGMLLAYADDTTSYGGTDG